MATKNKPTRPVKEFKPVELVSPKGRKETAKNNKQLADRLAAGYTLFKPKGAPANSTGTNASQKGS